MIFVDISGFTKLSERLARLGKILGRLGIVSRRDVRPIQHVNGR